MAELRMPTRRRLLGTGAALGGMGLLGARSSWAQGGSGINWRKHAGTTIEVSLIRSPRGDTLQRHQKEFEDLTGIKVNAEQTPEQQQRQKATIELASGKPSFDVVHLSYLVQ